MTGGGGGVLLQTDTTDPKGSQATKPTAGIPGVCGRATALKRTRSLSKKSAVGCSVCRGLLATIPHHALSTHNTHPTKVGSLAIEVELVSKLEYWYRPVGSRQFQSFGSFDCSCQRSRNEMSALATLELLNHTHCKPTYGVDNDGWSRMRNKECAFVVL